MSRSDLTNIATLRAFSLLPDHLGETCKLQDVLRKAAGSPLVIMGEVYAIPALVALEVQLLKQMVHASRRRVRDGAPDTSQPRVHLILEHFNFAMQEMLDDYMAGTMTFESLLSACVTSTIELCTRLHSSPAFRGAKRPAGCLCFLTSI